MSIAAWDAYPDGGIQVGAFPADLAELYLRPPGALEAWPPFQIRYLSKYLRLLNCQTVLIEKHYVDRDYIEDSALFYARSLRNYPNYCERLHFFREQFDAARWREFITDTTRRKQSEAYLQDQYLGFSVARPLPGSRVGRTVVQTLGPVNDDGDERIFAGTREYEVNLAGFNLSIRGLAFQQQDRGVSACATTALWSSLHFVAPGESLALPTPAQITQAACRYLLYTGRPLPSEGLSIEQMCEAIRASGLAPLVVIVQDPPHARAHLMAYLSSGFPPVLAIRGIDTSLGHAVCSVGLKVKQGGLLPPEAGVSFREAASAVRGIYVHDDRLGPYAVADLADHQRKGDDRTYTAMSIRFPTEPEEYLERSWIQALIVPVPVKLRLTVARLRVLAFAIAQALGASIMPEYNGTITLNCRYRLGSHYRQDAATFGLSADGLYRIAVDLVLSRFVGVIEFTTPDGPLFDVLVDATETEANPSVLACVRRVALPEKYTSVFSALAGQLGAPSVV